MQQIDYEYAYPVRENLVDKIVILLIKIGMEMSKIIKTIANSIKWVVKKLIA